jgi:hypothetical protein
MYCGVTAVPLRCHCGATAVPLRCLCGAGGAANVFLENAVARLSKLLCAGHGLPKPWCTTRVLASWNGRIAVRPEFRQGILKRHLGVRGLFPPFAEMRKCCNAAYKSDANEPSMSPATPRKSGKIAVYQKPSWDSAPFPDRHQRTSPRLRIEPRANSLSRGKWCTLCTPAGTQPRLLGLSQARCAQLPARRQPSAHSALEKQLPPRHGRKSRALRTPVGWVRRGNVPSSQPAPRCA